jgi:hypothetical protein
MSSCGVCIKNFLYMKKQWKPTHSKEKGGKPPTGQSPRNSREACHNIGIALPQNIVKKKPKYHEEQQKLALGILFAHPPTTVERERSRSANKMLHADMIVGTQ